jgi:TP901 family phage tail tape measure protein
MSDFEKSYSVKFNVATALKNLEKLDEVLDKIEDNKLVKVFSSMERKLKSFEKQAKKTGKELDKALGKDAKRRARELKEESKKAAKEVKNIGTSAASTTVSLKTFGNTMMKYVVAPLTAIGVASIKAAFDINKSMANVASLLEEPEKKIHNLKAGIQDLAIETGQPTAELADGLYQVVSALGESEENMEQLTLASKAAKAGVSSAADAIGMLSTVGKGYNDVSAESLANTADLAFQTVKLGVTTFPELAASMGKVVPLAAAMNTSQEELFGTMATLTGVTGNTSEVTTQLASVYSAFMTPGEAMQNAIKKINKQNKEYNFQSASAMMKALGFKKSLELLNEAADGNQDKLAKMLKRKEALIATLPLVSTQSENYTEKIAAMSDATGAMNEAFERQTNGINKQGHEWEVTKQRMIVFSQRLGERLLPVLDKLLDTVEPIIKVLEEMDEAAFDSAISFGKMALKTALLFKALSKVSEVSSGLKGLLGGIGSNASKSVGGVNKLSASMSKLATGIGAVAAAYGLAVIARDYFVEEQETSMKRKRSEAAARRKALKTGFAGLSDEELKAEKSKQQAALSRAEEDKLGFFVGDESEVKRRGAALEQQRAVVSKVEEEIYLRKNPEERDINRIEDLPTQRGGGGSLYDPWGGAGSVGGGGGGGQNINVQVGPTTVNSGADPESVGRVLDKRDRELKQKLKRAISEAARAQN